jgi:hypothetical protein
MDFMSRELGRDFMGLFKLAIWRVLIHDPFWENPGKFRGISDFQQISVFQIFSKFQYFRFSAKASYDVSMCVWLSKLLVMTEFQLTWFEHQHLGVFSHVATTETTQGSVPVTVLKCLIVKQRLGRLGRLGINWRPLNSTNGWSLYSVLIAPLITITTQAHDFNSTGSWGDLLVWSEDVNQYPLLN